MREKQKKFLTMGIFILCVMLSNVLSVHAADSTPIEYDNGMVVQQFDDITTYREEDAFTVPENPEGFEDYVFAGWYTDVDCKNALSTTVTSESITDSNKVAYAKFVPEEILSIKAQLICGTDYDTESTEIRFITIVPLDEALRNLGYDAYYSESIGKIYGANVSMGNLRQACLNSEQSDVTILTVGTGAGAEVEETDRRDITLTPEELDAVRYLRKYVKKLVVVVYAGSAVDLKEFDKLADAVVLAGFGGQNVSQAVANVLIGKANPSGRLTETYAYSLADIPSEHTYRDEAVMVYEEGLNVGYRYFETQRVPVLYPFGHGLSYSDFKYSDLKVVEKEDNIEVTLQVENISDRDGKEVVQLYVNEEEPTVYRPIRELKAFEKVFVKAHESVEVKFLLGKNVFSYYSAEKEKWEVNSGTFLIEVCKNAHEVIMEGRVCI